MSRLGYLDDTHSMDCDCVKPQWMAHLLSCRLLDEACTADDLATVTERAKACVRKWEKLCEGHERKEDLALSIYVTRVFPPGCLSPTPSFSRYCGIHSLATYHFSRLTANSNSNTHNYDTEIKRRHLNFSKNIFSKI